MSAHIEHQPKGEPCAHVWPKGHPLAGTVCGQAARLHRAKRIRIDTRLAREREIFQGIDGEGQTDHDTGRHRYVMLCAADERGETWTIENPRGLSTVQCLDFLLSLPSLHRKTFAYSFGYDLTKILEDVDDLQLYRLFRPELRRRVIVTPKGSRTVLVPEFWHGYAMNWLNGRFTVKKILGRKGTRFVYGKPHTVRDIWRFFQGKFTTALEQWKVPEGEALRDEFLARMRDMKDKRAQFDRLERAQVHAYCLDECRCMGELARKLTDAHDTAGIPLRNYFGAGSSASAMLEVMGVKEHIREAREKNAEPAAVTEAIRRAFFGGRFENSVLGPVPGPVFAFDISSAYPYQLCFLPCLIHGKWKLTRKRKDLDRARTALVRYTLAKPEKKLAWAPFPFRLLDGTIVYPESSGGGWVYSAEYLAGERLFPNVRFVEAWVYSAECDCKPFERIPHFYRERVRLGKEGAGIVLKLGTNSCYGKTAQFIGGELGTYTSWFWAGLITSGCRAQILDALGRASDMRNVLSIATDGIASLERLNLPAPRDTGTGWTECPAPKPKDREKSPELYRGGVDGPWQVNKPLGGWEGKVVERGTFFARPGISSPLEPSEDDLGEVRGRGLGRSVVYEHWQAIVEAYERGAPSVHVKDLSRFIGAKTAITRGGNEGAFKYTRAAEYGRWVNRPVELSFDPLPKREGFTTDERGLKRLELRSFEGLESLPYRRGVLSPEAQQLRALTEVALEQPDGGELTDYDDMFT